MISAGHSVRPAVEQLEAGHQLWKTTHHPPAAAMLGSTYGSGYGSGYTEDVPHLRRCLENRLFDLEATVELPHCPLVA